MPRIQRGERMTPPELSGMTPKTPARSRRAVAPVKRDVAPTQTGDSAAYIAMDDASRAEWLEMTDQQRTDWMKSAERAGRRAVAAWMERTK